MSEPQRKPKRRFWRAARRAFRWFRIGVWLIVLAVLILLIWLHRHGLPEFARERLIAELRLHGVDLQFTRMRLVWFRGIVAENVEFGRSSQTNGPRASATEAELHLHLKPLLQRRLDIEGVELRGGHVIAPVWGTNDTPQEIAIEKVNGELRFLPGDQWELSRFQAEVFGVGLRVSGHVTNATAVRSWKIGRTRPREQTPEAFWHDLVREFQRTKFDPRSEIVSSISGDAKRLDSFRARVTVRSAAIESSYGKGSNFALAANITPQPGALLYAQVAMSAQNAETRWGHAESIDLRAQLTPSLTQWTPTNAHVELEVKRAQTPWGGAATFAIQADFRPNPSGAESALAQYSIRGQRVQTPWARFAQAELTSDGVVSASNAWPSTAKAQLKFAGGEIAAGRAAAGTIDASLVLPPWDEMQFADTNVSWWGRAEKVSGEVSARLTAVRTPQIDATNLIVATDWKPPLLSIRQFSAALDRGDLQGTARLDTHTRELLAEARSSFDPKPFSSLLSSNGRRWLAQFTWEEPPKGRATARLTLPPWTNSVSWKDVDWRREVFPSLSLAGQFDVGVSTFREIAVSSAQSDFSYSNRTWRLPNLLLTRGDQRASIAHVSNEETREFSFNIDSTVDPRVLRPLFEPAVHEYLDAFRLTVPPRVHAEIAGQWHAPESISARLQFSATNFAYRDRPVEWCRSLATFTNRLLTFVQPALGRSEGTARADSVAIDTRRGKIYINNATGKLDVAAVTHAIHPSVEEVMAPYRFIAAPYARAHGVVDAHDEAQCNLRFDVAGGPFEWESFRFQQITGQVHWAGLSLTLSNVAASMYGGHVAGSAAFDFDQPRGARFAFRTLVHDINFHALMSDLSSPTNKLEGTLSGLLVVTNANSENPLSWFGHGNATLTDGLIWDVPVVGFFSPILNTIKPGAGNSRARDGSAVFIITNSVIFTDDLRVHASGMRLTYDGWVDFEGRINGRMEAQLFRDTPGVGQVVSKVFWPVTKLFEYRVGGTLANPKFQPLFIPKIIMMPFHPMRSLKELLGDEDSPRLGPTP